MSSDLASRAVADGIELDADFIQSAESLLAAQVAVPRTSADETKHAFWSTKYRTEAARNWDIFYKRNQTNFFKDRHWLAREFPDLAVKPDSGRLVLLEAGCGVGNLVFPALRDNPALFVYACDFSPRAIEHVRAHTDYTALGRCHAFVADVTASTTQPLQQLIPEPVDAITCIYVLSALPPEQHSRAFFHLASCMRIGAVLLLRDYGRYDLAQLRFSPQNRIEEGLYARADGTMAYYFTREEVRRLAEAAGLEGTVEWRRDAKVNNKTGVQMERVWVQARLVKVREVSLDVSEASSRVVMEVGANLHA